jgi:hypothetical protein
MRHLKKKRLEKTAQHKHNTAKDKTWDQAEETTTDMDTQAGDRWGEHERRQKEDKTRQDKTRRPKK